MEGVCGAVSRRRDDGPYGLERVGWEAGRAWDWGATVRGGRSGRVMCEQQREMRRRSASQPRQCQMAFHHRYALGRTRTDHGHVRRTLVNYYSLYAS